MQTCVRFANQSGTYFLCDFHFVLDPQYMLQLISSSWSFKQKVVWNKKCHPLNLIKFSCSWPGKGAPANWEQFLNCRLVRLFCSAQGKALIFFPCMWALWKLPCVKLTSVILHESRDWRKGLGDSSLAQTLWPSHATGTAQEAAQELSRKPSKKEKATCFGILVCCWDYQWFLVPLGTGFVTQLLDLWELK